MTTRLPGIRAISIATGAALLLGLALTTAPAAARRLPARARGEAGHGHEGQAQRAGPRRPARAAAPRLPGPPGRRAVRPHDAPGRPPLPAPGGPAGRRGRRDEDAAGARADRAVHARPLPPGPGPPGRGAPARGRAPPGRGPRRSAPRPGDAGPAPGVARSGARRRAGGARAAAATATPAAKPGAVASARHGLPGGPDLTAALATLIVIATWLLVRQAPPREGRPALALGGGGMVPAGIAASGVERAGGAEPPRVAGGEPRARRACARRGRRDARRGRD